MLPGAASAALCSSRMWSAASREVSNSLPQSPQAIFPSPFFLALPAVLAFALALGCERGLGRRPSAWEY